MVTKCHHLKHRLNKEGSESVTKCNRLKLEAADGKKYPTDIANIGTFTSQISVRKLYTIY